MKALPFEWMFITNASWAWFVVRKDLNAYVSGSEKASGPAKLVLQGFLYSAFASVTFPVIESP